MKRRQEQMSERQLTVVRALPFAVLSLACAACEAVAPTTKQFMPSSSINDKYDAIM